MFADLLSWWLAQMRDLAAPLTRFLYARDRDGLVLKADETDQETWHLFRRRRGVMTRLGSLPPGATLDIWRRAFASRGRNEKVFVALGRAFMTRQTTMPVAAAASMDRVLGYEMDRLTPFAANDVMFAYRVAARDPVAGVLRVELAVVPKSWTDRVLERLKTLSIRPVALEAPAGPASEPDTIRRIPLVHTNPSRQARARLGWQIGLAAYAALALAVVVTPIARQSLALADVEDRIALMRPHMDQVDTLRRRIASGTEGAGQIAAARARATDLLRILGVLTDILPNDTFLTSLAFRREQVTIEGNSAAATKIIPAMAVEPRLRNPSFAAPVLRSENGKDVFTIQAGLAP